MSDQDMKDIIAFLKTLTDGYTSPKASLATNQAH